MKLPFLVPRCLPWFNLSGALLVALLQRTPVLRSVMVAEEFVLASPVGAVLRAAATAAASLGALHTLAGATQFVQSPGNPVTGVVGQPLNMGFTIVGSPLPPAFFTTTDSLPPGLHFSPDIQGGKVDSGTPSIVGTPTQAGSYSITVTGSDGSFSQSDTIQFEITGGATAVAPTITTQPANQRAEAGGTVALTTVANAGSGGSPPSFQWLVNGSNVSGATSGTLTIANLQPADAGIYQAVVASGSASTTTSAAIVGVATTSKVVGAGGEVGSDIFLASNGNTFDQVLLTGAAATITADAGQITRISFLDLTNDIVQVEFSGAGTLSLLLDNPTGPVAPVNYNQAVTYMRGHPTIIITGANETTNLGIFSVGRITAVNQALFKDEVTYDGMADVAVVAISSTTGKFGGFRAANASFFATKGLTGIYAPGIEFAGPVFISDINGSDQATPVFQIGSSPDTRITGGDLLQDNGRSVLVSGLTQLKFTAGSTSHVASSLSAKTNRALLLQNGTDVTSQVAANPSP